MAEELLSYFCYQCPPLRICIEMAKTGNCQIRDKALYYGRMCHNRIRLT